MSEPLAYHVVFGTYGSWLPNDPRGSRSSAVWAPNLRPFGQATLTEESRSLAAVPHDQALRQAGQQALTYPPVVFDGPQALSVGLGFGKQIATSNYVVHACAILPYHVHVVIVRHRYSIKQVVRLLKQAATASLLADNRHPFAELRGANNELPTVWAEEGWNVCLNTEEDVARAVEYVEENPIKEGKPRQRWSFVTPFRGLEARLSDGP